MAAIIELIQILSGKILFGDIAQDFYGFRAMVLRLDPYPPLGPALQTIGVIWPVTLTHASTHPPTAYLLTAPVAFLPWPIAVALWGWLMVAAVIASLRLYGLHWRWIALIMVALSFWPPFVYSLMQLTPLWLLGTALAHNNREKPLVAGVWIAFASLTKFFPALILVPFILRRKWAAIAGFSAVWLAALALIVALQMEAIVRYVAVNQGNSLDMMVRIDNAAFLPTLFRLAGWPGAVLGMTLLAVVAWQGRHEWYTWEFLAVATLPIAWIYSLLPLLPGFVRNWKQPIVGVAIVISLFAPPFGVISALFQALAILIIGIGYMNITRFAIMPSTTFRSRT